ncbi:MAG: 2-hydroxychromene-2-carboxylate isomerase [Burkholderiales bacterium]
MPAPIDFYFDFSSPYGYFASTKIDALAGKYRREAIWRPVLLGAVLKVTGAQPLPMVPLKGDYSKHDMARSARLHQIPFTLPSVFPIASQAPARAFYWLNARNPAQARKLAQAFFHAYFVDDINISNPDDAVKVAEKFGLNAAEVRAAINDAVVKEKLKTEVEQSIARGVFGSPYIVIDNEPFWGFDRLEQVEQWLAGGW